MTDPCSLIKPAWSITLRSTSRPPGAKPQGMTAASMESPFTKLNLRRNPFGELTWEERAELAVVDTQPWVEFLAPPGDGRAVHRPQWARENDAPVGDRPFDARGVYVHIPEVGPRPAMPNQRPLLIDEAQRLGFWQRHRVFAFGGPLVLGTHDDLSKPLRRSGLDVVTVDVAADRSAERLMRILNRRIEASRLTAETYLGSNWHMPYHCGRLRLQYPQVSNSIFIFNSSTWRRRGCHGRLRVDHRTE